MIIDKENSDSMLLNDLLSEERPWDEFLESNNTENTNATSDLSVIHQYSQADIWLIKLPGLRWARQVYEEQQPKLCQDQINDFDCFEFIPDDTKKRIRPRAIECIARIVSYEAWDYVNDELADRLMISLSIMSLFITLLATPVWFPYQRTMFEWIMVYVATIVFAVIALAFSVSIADLITNRFLYILAFISSVITGLLVAYRLNWLSAFIQDGIRAGFIGYSILIWSLVFASALNNLIHNIIWKRKITLYPEDEIVQTLCTVLALIKNNPDKWPNFSFKSNVIHDIEWVAKRIEKELPRSISTWDNSTHVWMLNCAERMAAHVRQLKQCILLSKQEARDTLIQSLAVKLIYAAEGHLGSLEQSDFQVTSSWQSHFLSSLRAVAAIGFPTLIVILLAIIPVKIDDSIRGTITTAAIGWGILSILELLEPKTSGRISSLKTTLDLLPKATKPDADT